MLGYTYELIGGSATEYHKVKESLDKYLYIDKTLQNLTLLAGNEYAVRYRSRNSYGYSAEYSPVLNFTMCVAELGVRNLTAVKIATDILMSWER